MQSRTVKEDPMQKQARERERVLAIRDRDEATEGTADEMTMALRRAYGMFR
jgi:hypothetical protein